MEIIKLFEINKKFCIFKLTNSRKLKKTEVTNKMLNTQANIKLNGYAVDGNDINMHI